MLFALWCENCWHSVLCMLQLCGRHPGSSKDHYSGCHHSFCAGSLPSCTAGGVYSQTRLSLEVTGVFICACLCNNIDMLGKAVKYVLLSIKSVCQIHFPTFASYIFFCCSLHHCSAKLYKAALNTHIRMIYEVSSEKE